MIEKIKGSFGDAGFNRYMVECECIKNGGTVTDIDSFNRYMVECE